MSSEIQEFTGKEFEKYKVSKPIGKMKRYIADGMG